MPSIAFKEDLGNLIKGLKELNKKYTIIPQNEKMDEDGLYTVTENQDSVHSKTLKFIHNLAQSLLSEKISVSNLGTWLTHISQTEIVDSQRYEMAKLLLTFLNQLVLDSSKFDDLYKLLPWAAKLLLTIDKVKEQIERLKRKIYFFQQQIEQAELLEIEKNSKENLIKNIDLFEKILLNENEDFSQQNYDDAVKNFEIFFTEIALAEFNKKEKSFTPDNKKTLRLKKENFKKFYKENIDGFKQKINKKSDTFIEKMITDQMKNLTSSLKEGLSSEEKIKQLDEIKQNLIQEKNSDWKNKSYTGFKDPILTEEIKLNISNQYEKSIQELETLKKNIELSKISDNTHLIYETNKQILKQLFEQLKKIEQCETDLLKLKEETKKIEKEDETKRSEFSNSPYINLLKETMRLLEKHEYIPFEEIEKIQTNSPDLNKIGFIFHLVYSGKNQKKLNTYSQQSGSLKYAASYFLSIFYKEDTEYHQLKEHKDTFLKDIKIRIQELEAEELKELSKKQAEFNALQRTTETDLEVQYKQLMEKCPQGLNSITLICKAIEEDLNNEKYESLNKPEDEPSIHYAAIAFAINYQGYREKIEYVQKILDGIIKNKDNNTSINDTALINAKESLEKTNLLLKNTKTKVEDILDNQKQNITLIVSYFENYKKYLLHNGSDEANAKKQIVEHLVNKSPQATSSLIQDKLSEKITEAEKKISKIPPGLHLEQIKEFIENGKEIIKKIEKTYNFLLNINFIGNGFEEKRAKLNEKINGLKKNIGEHQKFINDEKNNLHSYKVSLLKSLCGRYIDRLNAYKEQKANPNIFSLFYSNKSRLKTNSITWELDLLKSLEKSNTDHSMKINISRLQNTLQKYLETHEKKHIPTERKSTNDLQLILAQLASDLAILNFDSNSPIPSSETKPLKK